MPAVATATGGRKRVGLTMGEKKSVTREMARKYRRANRKGKQRILDGFIRLTKYNRKYAIHMLANWGKEKLRRVDGKLVKFVVGKPPKRRKRVGRRLYDEEVRKAVHKLWQLFDYMCGKRLVVIIRLNIAVLAHEADLGIDTTVRQKLTQISAATIDRMLAPERKKLQLKGRSYTRPGTLLKHQIPIRTFFDWDERKPGFFEADTVAHDGGNSSGEFCMTLTLTDVYSGWVELRALPNRAHRWVKEEVEAIRAQLPFAFKGIDSDNGGEFINHQLWNWANEHQITFTRSRAYRKNDNCFVEQKNDLAVRRTVGYYRFDTQAEYEALKEVYTHLCPLLNFYYPSVKIIEKIRIGARVKKKYDPPKPPYQRLLESTDVNDSVKEKLRRQAQKLNIIRQKRLLDQAVARLMRIHDERNQGRLDLGCDAAIHVLHEGAAK
jgi:hypothetical protein